MVTKYKPIIKIWDGTVAHSSFDTLISSDIASKLQLEGFETFHRGQWSFEDLHNGTVAFVTHPRRLASINPFTVSQRDAEKFIIQMYKGALPKNISMVVAAHGHTTRGSLEDEPFRIINLPCWTTFIEYQRALTNFPHIQPDIGGYFILVTKNGRIQTQKWLYKPFVYNHFEGKIYEGNGESNPVLSKKYAPLNKVELESYFKEIVNTATFKVLAVADFHVGEVGAVAPEKYRMEGRDIPLQLTEANKRLLSYWTNMVKVIKLTQPNEIWIVGDPLAGTQVFEKTRRTLTLNLDEQKAMLIELFKMLK